MSDLTGWLFVRGHAADLILLVMLAEGIWLVWHGRWPPRDAVLRLMPGALMMLALRAALTGMAWPWIALPLALSFPVHIADLRRK